MGVFKQRTAHIRINGITDYDDNAIQDVDKVALYTFSYPDCHFEFRISEIDTESPNSCYLRIYGVSEDTSKMFETKQFADMKRQQMCTITYGYDEQEEIVYHGTISRVKYHFDFGNQFMEILLDQNNKKARVQKQSFCIQRSTSLYEAVQVVCQTFGYTFKCLNPDDFQSITIAPVTLEGNVMQCLKMLLNKRMSYYIDMDNIVTFSSNRTIEKEYTLTFKNGLISYPILDTNKLNEGEIYNIKHKLIPTMRAGTTINIPVEDNGRFSENDTGKYAKFRVTEYVSTFSPTQDITEMECVKING